MNLLLQTLGKAQRSKQIVAIYTDPSSPGSSSIGYVKGIGKEVVTLASLTSGGESDGLVVRKLSHIFKAEVGGVYAQKLAVLNSHEPHSSDRGKSEERTNGVAQFQEALESAKAGGLIVSIWLEMDTDDSYTSGFVERVQSKEVLIRKLDDYGRADGFVVFSITDIEALDMDGSTERRLGLLHKAANYDYSWPLQEGRS
jgi:hypothetical protein